MAKIESFEVDAERYDTWFERHDAVRVSEPLALRPFVPLNGHGPEIGVGSGRLVRRTLRRFLAPPAAMTAPAEWPFGKHLPCRIVPNLAASAWRA